ncbi:hypothetical protein BpHYR1_012481 [Brachionus plicatilis]|uniref:Uncharacterized protein n=1 Tax=Brachionus plicatilis TaxID=10195 RepID=A0A3M7SW12_BRAPC|nr:hypothetical protein BpHYR1_012481 [Brachionus plicatilis]
MKQIIIFIVSICSVLGQDMYSSVNRDGYGRPDPNSLLNGFFPAWAIILLCLAGLFLLISVLSYGLYVLGCRKPHTEFKKVQLR